MEKIKSLLRPGHEKDDETLYGSGEGHHGSASHNTGADTATGQRESNAEGVAHQFTNPSGDKYDETAYGPAGSHTGVEQLPATASGDQHLYTDPAAQKKEHGVLRQILNPGGDKYDSTRYGTTATTEPPTGMHSHEDHRLSNPNAASTTTSTHPPFSSDTTANTTGTGSTQNELSHHVHNQVTSLPSSHTHSHAAHAAATGTTTRHHDDHDSRHGRETALVGGAAGAAAGGLAATHEARKHHDHGAAEGGLSHHVHNYLYEGPTGGSHAGAGTGSAQSGTSTLDAPRPALGDASSVASIKSGVVGREPEMSTQRPGGATGGILPSVPDTGGKFLGEGSTSDRSFPLSSGTTSTLPDRTISHNTAGGNHGREGLAAAAGAATATTFASQTVKHEHHGHGHDYLGANIDEKTSTGGPHATTIANRLDPHLHGKHTISSGTAGTGLSSTNTTGSEHHHGRDAALAGGLGAGAAGAYAASRNEGTNTGPAPNTIGPHDKDWKNVLDPRVQPNPALQKSAGPDATGPASNTIGPHDKDWKNVIDPRVQPNPALQKSASTTSDTGPAASTIGPHDKDWKNVIDPRVRPDPAVQKGDHSAAAATGVAHPTDHQARDAGLIAGGGALGAAGAAGLGHHSSNTPTGPAGTTSTSSAAPGTAFTTSGQHAAPAPGADTTGTSHEHHGSRDVAAAGGAGAAGIAASRAFNKHEHPTIVGEKGMGSKEANPYSSHGLDPRVDGSRAHHTSGTSGLAPATGTSTVTDTKHHLSRDAGITGATLGAGGVGAHELSQHHGEQIGGEGLGAHDPATHHGVAGTSAGATTTGAFHGHHAPTGAAIPGHSVSSDRAADVYPSPGDKLSTSRSEHNGTGTGEKKGLGDKIMGMLHLGGSSSTGHKEDHHATTSEEHTSHSQHDDRNRLHKEPKHGYPSSSTANAPMTEGTTIGTGSGITAATVPHSEEGATKTGREMGA